MIYMMNVGYMSSDMNLSTNRGNHLAVSMLKYRYPNVFRPEQIQNITLILRKPLERCRFKPIFVFR